MPTEGRAVFLSTTKWWQLKSQQPEVIWLQRLRISGLRGKLISGLTNWLIQTLPRLNASSCPLCRQEPIQRPFSREVGSNARLLTINRVGVEKVSLWQSRMMLNVSRF
jgi:hypothetical protein